MRPAAIAFSPVVRELVVSGQDVKLRSAESRAPAAPADPQSRLQGLISQVKDLQNALEALSEDLKKQQPPKDPAEKK